MKNPQAEVQQWCLVALKSYIIRLASDSCGLFFFLTSVFICLVGGFLLVCSGEEGICLRWLWLLFWGFFLFVLKTIGFLHVWKRMNSGKFIQLQRWCRQELCAVSTGHQPSQRVSGEGKTDEQVGCWQTHIEQRCQISPCLQVVFALIWTCIHLCAYVPTRSHKTS